MKNTNEKTRKKEKKGKFHFLGWKKKFGPFLDLCVSFLRRGHANLLCIVPILSDVSEEPRGDVHFQYI